MPLRSKGMWLPVTMMAGRPRPAQQRQGQAWVMLRRSRAQSPSAAPHARRLGRLRGYWAAGPARSAPPPAEAAGAQEGLGEGAADVRRQAVDEASHPLVPKRTPVLSEISGKQFYRCRALIHQRQSARRGMVLARRSFRGFQCQAAPMSSAQRSPRSGRRQWRSARRRRQPSRSMP